MIKKEMSKNGLVELFRFLCSVWVAYFHGFFPILSNKFDGVNISDENEELLSLSPEEHVQRYIDEGMTKMDATKRAAKDRGMSKSELYKILNS